MTKLTAKQTAFADAILDGKTGSDAYRIAYNTKGSNRAVARKAVDLMKHPAIIAYIKDMRSRVQTKKIMDKQEMLQELTEIARAKKKEGKEATTTRVSAMERIAKMQGFDAPQKIEAKVEGSLLDRIRKGNKSK